MADNVAITPGSGDTVAADDIGGVKHQRVKVEFGADGSATDVSSAAPLPTSQFSVGAGASTAVSVVATGSGTSVAAARASRLSLILTNDSDTVVYGALGASAAVNSGFRLNPNGDRIELVGWVGAVQCINAGSGTKTVLVTEIF